MTDQQDDAAQRAAEAMEQALLKATQRIESELARIVRTGEDDLDRLARRFFQRFAELALEGVLDNALGGSAPDVAGDATRSSINQAAATIARAARRGARFI